MAIKTSCIAVLAACLGVSSAFAQKTTPRFKVIAFYTGKADAAHISFVNALEWLGTGKKPQSPGGNQPGNLTSGANRTSRSIRVGRSSPRPVFLTP